MSIVDIRDGGCEPTAGLLAAWLYGIFLQRKSPAVTTGNNRCKAAARRLTAMEATDPNAIITEVAKLGPQVCRVA